MTGANAPAGLTNVPARIAAAASAATFEAKRKKKERKRSAERFIQIRALIYKWNVITVNAHQVREYP